MSTLENQVDTNWKLLHERGGAEGAEVNSRGVQDFSNIDLAPKVPRLIAVA